MIERGESQDSINVRRRNLLKFSAVALTTASFPSMARASQNNHSSRKIDFLNLHTNESLHCCYWEYGEYRQDGLNEINYILRDHRANEVYAMDRALIDLLQAIHDSVGSNAPYHVISAYRSAKTNEHLRKTVSGVAKQSLHVQGKAIDVRLPDIKLSQLRDVAISYQAGGVGYYQDSQFIHLDVGRTRTW